MTETATTTVTTGQETETMRFEGVHHVTCITGDAPRNVDFYARVLGLRLVKKTVNQDDPFVYHLFYADETVCTIPSPARPRRAPGYSKKVMSAPALPASSA